MFILISNFYTKYFQQNKHERIWIIEIYTVTIYFIETLLLDIRQQCKYITDESIPRSANDYPLDLE